MSTIKSTQYKEEQARKTLHYICNFTLDDWCCSDKPDLQNDVDGYGIEVVQDVYRNEQEMSRFIESFWGKQYSEIDEQKIKKFEGLGGTIKVENGRISGASLGTTTNSPDHLIAVAKGKIDLLNRGQYRSFKKYGLYVFVGTTLVDQDFSSYAQQIIEEVASYQQTKDLKYSILFLDQHYVMCVCDLEKKSFEYELIPKEIRQRIHRETRELWHD